MINLIPRPCHIIKERSHQDKRKLSDDEKKGVAIAYEHIKRWIEQYETSPDVPKQED